MITVAQSVYKETILRKTLMNQSLFINLELQLDNKMNSKVNDSCPFIFRIWKLHHELRGPGASLNRSSSCMSRGRNADLPCPLLQSVYPALHTYKAPLPFHLKSLSLYASWAQELL